MTMEQSWIEAVRSLPPEKQQELLEHAHRVRVEPLAKKPFKNIKGLWAVMGISISAEEIDEMRCESGITSRGKTSDGS